MNKAILLFLFLLVASRMQATVLNVPSQYFTIQSALDSCSQGDTVMVAPGTYYEHLVWPDVSNIKLFSSGNKTNTIIDGSKSGRVITIDMLNANVINKGTHIKGFTITRGGITLSEATPSGEGAGVLLNNASPKFTNCNFTKNYIVSGATISTNLIGKGVGISCKKSQATFTKCLFKSNTSKFINEIYGSALYAENSSISFTDCEVSENSTKTAFENQGQAAGVIHAVNSTLNILRCSITGNEIRDNSETYPSGIITVIEGSAEIVNTMLRDNTHWGASEISPEGSAIYGDHSDLYILNVTSNQNGSVFGLTGPSLYLVNFASNTITVQNSIFWNNGANDEIYTDNSGVISVTYSDVKSFTLYPGIGNINVNPQFISIPGDNLSLTPGSPCAGTGSLLNAPDNDIMGTPRPLPAGTNPDMGCYEINQPLKVDGMVSCCSGFVVYPNPSNGNFAIDLQIDNANNEPASIEIINSLGQIIYTQSVKLTDDSPHQNISMPATCSEGLYFVRVKVIDQVFQQSIVYKN